MISYIMVYVRVSIIVSIITISIYLFATLYYMMVFYSV